MKKLLGLSIMAISTISFSVPTFANIMMSGHLFSAMVSSSDTFVTSFGNFEFIETLEEMKKRMQSSDSSVVLFSNIKNVFSDWESYYIPRSVLTYNELTYNNVSNIDRFASFSDNIDIPLQTNENSSYFYTFDATGYEYVLIWSSDLQDDLRVNIGLSNLDTNTSAGWIPNMKAYDVALFSIRNGSRFGVRVSSANRDATATLNVLGIN